MPHNGVCGEFMQPPNLVVAGCLSDTGIHCLLFASSGMRFEEGRQACAKNIRYEELEKPRILQTMVMSKTKEKSFLKCASNSEKTKSFNKIQSK